MRPFTLPLRVGASRLKRVDGADGTAAVCFPKGRPARAPILPDYPIIAASGRWKGDRLGGYRSCILAIISIVKAHVFRQLQSETFVAGCDGDLSCRARRVLSSETRSRVLNSRSTSRKGSVRVRPSVEWTTHVARAHASLNQP
jgi:hypothetical protein